MKLQSKSYWVYILKCDDGTLYTGITIDVEKRLRNHNLGKASKYTRARLPVRLCYVEKVADKGLALKEEWRIKQLSKVEKCKMFNQ